MKGRKAGNSGGGVRERHRGFTLIEILIAIFILAVVLSTIYAAYTGTLRIVRGFDYDSEVYSMARSAMSRMIRDLGALSPYNGGYEFRSEVLDLAGEPFLRLTFRSDAHLAFRGNEAGTGVGIVTYDIRKDPHEEGYVLWRVDDIQGGREAEQAVEDQAGGYVLCERIQSLRYVFYDAQGQEYERWDSVSETPSQKKKAPAVVRIDLKLINPENPEAPFPFSTRIYLSSGEVGREGA
ncbi:MAG: prepilin-type N-terminal cleavage/methylation domain-containing protein [Deltaproteobacteria bacterium]|nr:prepilin-type N-terminal cleavage/methylation domain-containing protein [Deltaproteobacteria bacterium]